MKTKLIELNNHPKILMEWRGFKIIKVKGLGNEWDGVLIIKESDNSRLSDLKEILRLKALARFLPG
jgi:hypothetical protein